MSKTIYKEIIIAASVKDVWQKWTTSDGIVDFFAPKATVELKINGKFELLFMLDNEIGSQGSEGCNILSYLPEKMLSFSWNAPPQFTTVRKEHHWYVLQFIAIDNNTTKLELNGLGFGDTDEWKEVYLYFDQAWSRVLDNLKSLFK